MADFSITISNTLTVLGPTPASLWGTMVWGQDFWGESKDFSFLIDKYIPNSFSLDSSVSRSVSKSFSNSISVASSLDICCLQDGSGYEYYLTGGVIDPDNRVFPVYTEQTASTPTYTEDGEDDPGWSEA